MKFKVTREKVCLRCGDASEKRLCPPCARACFIDGAAKIEHGGSDCKPMVRIRETVTIRHDDGTLLNTRTVAEHYIFRDEVLDQDEVPLRTHKELSKWRCRLLRDAVLCEDSADFVRALIDDAKREGLTTDGKTLLENA